MALVTVTNTNGDETKTWEIGQLNADTLVEVLERLEGPCNEEKV